MRFFSKSKQDLAPDKKRSKDDKCHGLNHVLLLDLSDMSKQDLWACRLFVFLAVRLLHIQNQFKHSCSVEGNSFTFIKNAKVTLKMQFINAQTVLFIWLRQINGSELDRHQTPVFQASGSTS